MYSPTHSEFESSVAAEINVGKCVHSGGLAFPEVSGK